MIMENISLKAHAKLNLSLNILPELGKGGYYRVKFLNTGISIFDSVTIHRLKRQIVRINEIRIDNEENIAYRAAKLMFDKFDLPGGVSIDITKSIPARAGLGGGSTDAAAVINGFSTLFDLRLGNAERLALARKIGMDVCYCVTGGLCEIGGVGETVKRLPLKPPDLHLLIATPHVKKPSTSWAYSTIKSGETGKYTEKMDNLIRAIREKNPYKIVSNIHNDFEKPVQRDYPVTGDLKKLMIENGAMNALLAGSGLSVFGIFKKEQDIIASKRELEKNNVECRIARTVDDRGD
ncbi:MAG TPA: 4-(cytidine 5'-diphospho)-2-C-methyl-D-erythritol kinase [Spirochaetes bacterium]|nr:4-(cytidine 5'-diphospho)-2-C-methyl-D-erythritol kinase [Spirochaetota bacterium]